MAQGMDGAFLLGCNHGDDYQCHFIKGSELSDVRVQKIGDALESLAKLPKMINDFVEEVEALGPNPFKGF